MLNLSKLVRKSEDIPLKDKFIEFFNPELYKAENVADYKNNKTLIVPPWFKRNPLLLSNYYAIIVFYNVGVDGIFDEGKLIEDFVKVHDGSDATVMCWTEPGGLLPAQKSYFQMLDNRELRLQDWIYRLVIRHSYEGALPFVAEVEKRKFINKKKKKNSVISRILQFFPEFSFAPT